MKIPKPVKIWICSKDLRMNHLDGCKHREYLMEGSMKPTCTITNDIRTYTPCNARQVLLKLEEIKQ